MKLFVNLYRGDEMYSSEQFTEDDFKTIEGAIEHYLRKSGWPGVDHWEIMSHEDGSDPFVLLESEF